ncbi:hypothetical protein J4H86_16380 [Spiractinospora alimapuensis]|uniref:hypothetical protein n=1 Tax=Spiractinospora alimapuensis TaxID=2820884 RepID=UPI001F33DF84|nr:hypothetical protein [Spiractinospora alimapuensis]QVQ50488.1 hypothetical protein J4H86_16380 [Spiractinospora alimapuensis]
MSDHPAQVRLAAQISHFLALAGERMRRPAGDVMAPDDDLAFFEHKAALFTRIAAESPDDELRQEVAARARAQLSEALRRHGVGGGER